MGKGASPEQVVREIQRRTPAVLGRGEGPHRPRRAAGRAERRGAVSARRAGAEPVLPLEQGVSRSREEAAAGGHDAGSDGPGGEGAARREWPPQAGAGGDRAGESPAQKKRDGLRLGGRYVRLTAAEKAEVIRLVEGSDLSVRRTLAELGVHRSTFYAWYRRYAEDGAAGLVAMPPAAQRYWNRIPPAVRERVVTAALADPDRSPRELAWQLTDRTGHFLSESSVYRILKAADLITSPAFILIHAADQFAHPTRRPNELWQTEPVLRVAGPRRLPDPARAHAHTGRAVSPDDAGEDRALSPVDEERGCTGPGSLDSFRS